MHFFFFRFLTIKERSHKVDSGGPCCPMPRVFMLPSYKTNPLRRGSAWLCWWDHSLHADPIWWDQSCRAESGSTARPHSLSCRLQETAAPHSGRRQGIVSVVCLHLLASKHYSFRCSEELGGFAKPQVPSKRSLQALLQCHGYAMQQLARALESLDKAAGQVN